MGSGVRRPVVPRTIIGSKPLMLVAPTSTSASPGRSSGSGELLDPQVVDASLLVEDHRPHAAPASSRSTQRWKFWLQGSLRPNTKCSLAPLESARWMPSPVA